MINLLYFGKCFLYHKYSHIIMCFNAKKNHIGPVVDLDSTKQPDVCDIPQKIS